MRITLLADGTTAQVSGRISPNLIADFDDWLAGYEPGYQHDPRYKFQGWDGKHHLFDQANPRQLHFPAGLLPRVVEALVAQGIAPEIVDHRPLPRWTGDLATPPVLHGVVLDEEQQAAIDLAVTFHRGTIAAATGWGKTELAAALAALIAPHRVLILVNRRGLMTQTADRLTLRLRELVGKIGDGWRQTGCRVTVATVQSCWAHLGTLRPFLQAQELLIVDEAHTIADMALKLLAQIPAPARIGLSATIKESPRPLYVEAYLGPILMETTLEALVDSGRAARPTVKMLQVGGMLFVETQDPSVVYRLGIERNVPRNRLIVDCVLQARQRGQQTVVLVWSIAHGHALAEALGGIPFLHGGTPLTVVDQTKAAFHAGTLADMVVSTIFDLGHDVPAIDVFVMAAAGRKPLRTIQRFGRAVRRKPTGDNVVTVLDFYDFAHPWLKGQAEMRARTYRAKGFTPRLLDLSQGLPDDVTVP